MDIYEWGYHTWAIPNQFKEVQDYVLGLLPKWAKVVKKGKQRSLNT